MHIESRSVLFVSLESGAFKSKASEWFIIII